MQNNRQIICKSGAPFLYLCQRNKQKTLSIMTIKTFLELNEIVNQLEQDGQDYIYTTEGIESTKKYDEALKKAQDAFKELEALGIDPFNPEHVAAEQNSQLTSDDIYLMIDEQNEVDLIAAIEATDEQKAVEVKKQLENKERKARILHRKAKTILREAQGLANNFKDKLGVSVHLLHDSANCRFSFDVQFVEVDEYSIYAQHQIVEFLYTLIGKCKDLKDVAFICELAEHSEA